MTHYLIDNNDDIIPISQQFINKSNVLKEYFKKNPKKGFKLNFPKKIIEQMIQDTEIQCLEQNNNDLMYDLYRKMGMQIPDKKERSEDIKMESTTGLYVPGHAQHIFNSLFFEGNKIHHTQYIESCYGPQYNYIVKINGKENEITQTEFDNTYSILNDKKCVKNDGITPVLRVRKKNPYKRLLAISIDYKKKMSIPPMKIIVDTYNIGKLIDKNMVGIKINSEIFNIVVSLISEHLDPLFNKKNVCVQSDIPYAHITEIQKNFENYVVKIKRISVGE